MSSEHAADASTTSKPVLETHDLTKRFGELVANDDVNLRVNDGELRAIIGPNGAGKTTLFNMITGALDATEGRVTLEGKDLTALPEEARPHEGIARSFQSNQMFEDETVLENVRVVVQTAQAGSFSLDLWGNGRDLGVTTADEFIELVGLGPIRDTVAKNLSHGDQRRLGMAMALATDPEVLLLDEPTSGMSPAETAETADLIEEIKQEYDLTVVLIEHDMDVVLSISDRITVLNRGSILATGSPEEIQNDQDVQDAYLGGVKEEI
jgi:branched-chain amino acid transport system ATP-binding protein